MYISIMIAIFISVSSESQTKEENDCVPQMVDVCFRGYYDQLSKVKSNSSDELLIDFCRNTLDRINCAQEVINSDCNNLIGKKNLQKWIESLMSVQNYLCEHSFQSMRELWETSPHGVRCWNMEKYFKCVEQKTKITHVIDMASVRMDVNECNWILIALSSCSSRNTDLNEKCHTTQSVLDEILHLFVQRSMCITPACASAARHVYSSVTKVITILFLYLNVHAFLI